MHKPFVHLRAHSDYSFLRSIVTPEKLVETASTMGMPAIALGDEGNMYGGMQFFLAAKNLQAKLEDENSLADAKVAQTEQLASVPTKTAVKPILATDLYFASELLKKNNGGSRSFNYQTQLPHGVFKLPAICETKEGYKNLCQLSSVSFQNMVDGIPCIDFSHLQKYHHGIIFLSGGFYGYLNQNLLTLSGSKASNKQKAEQFILDMVNLKKEVAQPSFYIEAQRHGVPQEEAVNVNLLSMAENHGIPVVATSEIFYLEKTHWETHEVFLAIGARAQMDMPRGFASGTRPRLPGTNYYFKTSEEMYAAFADIPEAIENTLAIANRCHVDIVDKVVHMPSFLAHDETTSSSEGRGGKVQEELLKQKTKQGLAALNIGKKEISLYEKRVDEELALINGMDFSGYFLIVSDIINAAKANGIMVGPGRGSVVGSLVSYCLGITSIDPLKYDLLFERFLTADRVSLPDIDIDFQDDLRDKVIDYVKEKYGKEQVCQIVTFARLKAKAVFKDVCRVFGIDFKLSNELSAVILNANSQELQGREVDTAEKSWLQLTYEYSFHFKTIVDRDPALQSAYKHALQLENLARQSGIHAAGVVIADKPISSYVPLSRSDGEVVVSQYDGRYLEEKCGLLKMDFLGLRTLTIIQQTLVSIEKNWQKVIDMDSLPEGDPPTYKLFSTGRTMGIFQFESAGMTRYVQELQPDKLDELIAMNALFRPGPMRWIPVYIANKNNKKPTFVDAGDEKKYAKLVSLSKKDHIIESILKPTQHIPIYQEQVMQISKGFAGFTSSEADILRSAIGKKKKDKIAIIRKQFISRAVKLGHDEKDAVFIYDDVIEAFGSYGFNKSHSASYAYLAYQVAYLKANYPAEFFTSFLNNELNNLSALGKFKRIVDECGEFAVEVTLPCVNKSGALFKAKPKKIEFGLAAIKGVGVGMAKIIESERERGGNYLGIANFIARVKDASSFNKQVIENLIKAGCFKNVLLQQFNFSFECDQIIYVFPQLFLRVEKEKELLRGGQMSFFQKESADNNLENKSGQHSIESNEYEDLLEEAKKVKTNTELCKQQEKEALGFLFRYDYSLKYSALIIEANRNLMFANKASASKSVIKEAQVLLAGKGGQWSAMVTGILKGLPKMSDNKNIRVACVVETVKEVFTKKDNKAMAIVAANVGFSFFGGLVIELLCFNGVWKKLKQYKFKEDFLLRDGKLLVLECREMRKQEGRSKTFSLEDAFPIDLENMGDVKKQPTTENTMQERFAANEGEANEGKIDILTKGSAAPAMSINNTAYIAEKNKEMAGEKEHRAAKYAATNVSLQNNNDKNEKKTNSLVITIDATGMNVAKYNILKEVITAHPGSYPVILSETIAEKRHSFFLGSSYGIDPNKKCIAALCELPFVTLAKVLPTAQTALMV